MLPTTLDIGMQSDHCHRVVAEHEHRVTLLSQKRTRKSLITTNPTNRYYCSHLSRTLLILDLFIIHARTGTCHNQLDELTNVSIDIVVPSWSGTISSNDIIIARRYRSKAKHPTYTRMYISMSCDWTCLIVRIMPRRASVEFESVSQHPQLWLFDMI